MEDGFRKNHEVAGPKKLSPLISLLLTAAKKKKNKNRQDNKETPDYKELN